MLVQEGGGHRTMVNGSKHLHGQTQASVFNEKQLLTSNTTSLGSKRHQASGVEDVERLPQDHRIAGGVSEKLSPTL